MDARRSAGQASAEPLWASFARRAIADFYRARRPVDVADSTELESMADPSAGIAEKLATFDGDHSAHEEVLSRIHPALLFSSGIHARVARFTGPDPRSRLPGPPAR
ncbi:MAG: hypothetical protein V3T72_07405 [Thermoanaerobaculia bacterium]